MSPKAAGMKLADVIKIRSQFQRSVNLERDSDGDLAANYIPTSRTVETIRRWALAMKDSNRPRAWSITGPYGSGKSSFALFMQALARAGESEARAAAERILGHANSEVVALLSTGRAQLGVRDTGFIRAVATAQREPAAETIMRALRGGAHGFWPQRMPRSVAEALRGTSRVPLKTKDVIAALQALSERAPVLLIIDEFGKNLEAFADDGPEADLYVLQELAEKVSGPSGLPVFFFTLQHLAFADYASGLGEQQRREWSKVQGRFEDVPFLDSVDQAVHVLASAFDYSAVPKPLQKRIDSWAHDLWASYRSLGLSNYFGQTWDRLASCYPLHPLAVVALPELCARYAQHSRTLFSFVAGPEGGSVASFLKAEAVSDPLPVVTLENVYQYFIDSAGSMIGASGEGTRWLEIERRLRETQGLSRDEERCLRTIAILNLISSGGAIRASLGAVTVTMASDQEPITPARTVKLIRHLERRGLVTYRDFADEYRIWQGSDFDGAAALSEARERLRGESIAKLLEQVSAAPSVVAARHSQRTGILRYFATRFADDLTEVLDVPVEADGLLVYQLGDHLSTGLTKALAKEPRPVIVISSPAVNRLRDATLDLAAHHDVLLNSAALASDWVARRELQEREAISRHRLSTALRDGFAGSEGTRVLANSGEKLNGRVGLMRLISELCDRFYNYTPEIRNEMIARRELTSQGAKARRELLNAMTANPSVERLGLTGYGPDRAMYEAVLSWTGLHRLTPEGSWAFQPPKKGSSWIGAWKTIAKLVEAGKTRHVAVSELWAALMAPPIGLKEGPIPVLCTSAILYWADEIAIYQDGTYQPMVDAALIERLLKTPERFSIKAFGLVGARGAVIEAVSQALGIVVRQSAKRRNSTVVSVMAPLLTRLRGLSAHSLHTKRLSDEALAVRQALMTAREPDQLLFSELPRAVGIEPFVASPTVSIKRATQFAEMLRNALVELEAEYSRLIGEIHDSLTREFAVPAGLRLREDLRSRARHLVGNVLDPKLRSALLMACDESLEDTDWLEAMAMTIGDRPPAEWRDEEVDQYHHRLHALALAFARVEALHFERRADHREGFDARRVTVTTPEGVEVSRVVWIDQRLETTVGEVAAAALADVDARIGPDGRAALLTLLAQQVFAEDLLDSPIAGTEFPREAVKR